MDSEPRFDRSAYDAAYQSDYPRPALRSPMRDGQDHVGRPQARSGRDRGLCGIARSDLAGTNDRKLRPVGDDHPPLAAGDELVGIEAESGHVAAASGHLSLASPPVLSRTIIDSDPTW